MNARVFCFRKIEPVKKMGFLSLSMYLFFACLVPAGVSQAQTSEDSLKLLQAEWRTVPCKHGLTARQSQIQTLFGSVQSVNVVEVKGSKRHKFHLGYVGHGMQTSHLARYFDADAAINGTFYDMKYFNSVCFLKKDGKVRDTTVTEEMYRGNGALKIRHGRLAIIPWDKEKERSCMSAHQEDIMTAGPLLLLDGSFYKSSIYGGGFGNSRHPRSAVGIKKDGTVVLVAVDGRQKGLAEGMSLTELAYTMKWLGCKDALNLDGGGSTTLYVKGTNADGGVINYPCDNKKYDHQGERRVANMLLVGGNY